jgi:hypothetical protein
MINEKDFYDFIYVRLQEEGITNLNEDILDSYFDISLFYLDNAEYIDDEDLKEYLYTSLIDCQIVPNITLIELWTDIVFEWLEMNEYEIEQEIIFKFDDYDE